MKYIFFVKAPTLCPTCLQDREVGQSRGTFPLGVGKFLNLLPKIYVLFQTKCHASGKLIILYFHVRKTGNSKQQIFGKSTKMLESKILRSHQLDFLYLSYLIRCLGYISREFIFFLQIESGPFLYF